MPTATNGSIEIYYDIIGTGDPVMLITGLGGAGRAWGDQVARFSSVFVTAVPDHRGTGRSSKPRPYEEVNGETRAYTVGGLAADMAATLRHIARGPAHVVGSSTGGAFAQVMALEHPDVVRSITLASSWARADDHFRHQFAARKRMLAEAGPMAYTEVTALFLYSPDYIRDRYAEVRAWCDSAADGTDPEIMAARIDMIVDHDTVGRLEKIDVPALVIVGADDVCTPPALSRELADLIPAAEYVEMPGGHLIYKEHPDLFFEHVSSFIRRS
ncbi:MAG: alpha/beta hydrolase [Acidimicrobiia bacterium]|nr:alpha/beta hydrolase [Acidimicrobiia bacterium]